MKFSRNEFKTIVNSTFTRRHGGEYFDHYDESPADDVLEYAISKYILHGEEFEVSAWDFLDGVDDCVNYLYEHYLDDVFELEVISNTDDVISLDGVSYNVLWI